MSDINYEDVIYEDSGDTIYQSFVPHQELDADQLACAETFVMSRDTSSHHTKMYQTFASAAAAADYVSKLPGCCLYEVLTDPSRPCLLFFDLDRRDLLYSNERMLSEFTSAMEEFLLEHFFAYRIVYGETAQVSESTNTLTKKTSIHVVLPDILVSSVIVHRAFTLKFNEWLWLHEKYPSLLQRVRDVVDISVYSQTRSYRMLGMKKWGPNVELKPMPGSSDRPGDHFVGYYPGFAAHPPSHTISGVASLAKTGFLQPKYRAATQAPTAECEEATAKLNAIPELLALLGGNPIAVKNIQHRDSCTLYVLDPHTNPICPVAGCAHEPSDNYHSGTYLQECIFTNKIKVCCYDPACAGYDDIYVRRSTPLMNRVHDEVYCNSMHTQEANIAWDEAYGGPGECLEVRPLPVLPIVCVRASMGLGKTKAVQQLLREHCKAKMKALIITFSRPLASKMSLDFPQFTLYQTVTTELINDNKIIVCLDSLWRVATRNFDFIIVDEAVSVFLHFDSSLMQKSSENSILIELLLSQKGCHSYFLDACMDITFMKNVVEYFGNMRGESPYWIWNKSIRPTRRTAIVESKYGGSMTASALMHRACLKVCELLSEGKRVVVCSSTKRFTVALEAFINRKLHARNPRVMVYHSGNKHGVDDVNQEWINYDALIYSPSITAGVSFEVPHFDALVAFLVNSVGTPTVDISLQQLFRVRRLSDDDARMFLFVQERVVKALPHLDGELDAVLSEETALVMRNYCDVGDQLRFRASTTFARGKYKYDSDRLSYQILKGIISMQNRSAMFYSQLLKATLASDYGIPVTEAQTPAEESDDVELLKDCLAVTSSSVPFECVPILSEQEYMLLKLKADKTAVESAAMKLYISMAYMWGIPRDLVDDAFYKKLVMGKDADSVYNEAKRFRMFSKRSLETNSHCFTAAVERILDTDDPNITIYRNAVTSSYVKLLTAQSFLQLLLSDSEYEQLASMQDIIVHKDSVDAALRKYMRGLQASEKKGAEKMFNLDKGPYKALKSIAGKAFGLTFSLCNSNSERDGYQQIRVSCSKLRELEQRYKPTFPHVHHQDDAADRGWLGRDLSE